jgi:hypothetical protein
MMPGKPSRETRRRRLEASKRRNRERGYTEEAVKAAARGMTPEERQQHLEQHPPGGAA